MQVEKLIDDGYDVRGYYYWTLLDNFEVRPLWQLCHPSPAHLCMPKSQHCPNNTSRCCFTIPPTIAIKCKCRSPLCLAQWNFAFELKFGLYEWVDNGKQERRLREGAKVPPTQSFSSLEHHS